MKTTYDVIVVGGGVNGLTAAAYLAKAGLEVLVLERRDEVGTHCSTEEVTIPGFRHNLHATWIIAGSSPVVADLDLPRFGFEPTLSDYAYGMPFADGQCALIHSSDAQKTYESFARFSQKDADTYLRLGMSLAPHIEELVRRIVFTPPSAESLLRAMELIESVDVLPAGIVEMNGFALLDVLFESERLKAMIASLQWIGGLPPWHPTVGSLGALMVLSLGPVYACHQLHGGSHMLPHALSRCVLRHQGTVLQSCPVERILVENGRAVGVRLSPDAVYDERELRARHAVISNVTVRPTFLDLVGEEQLPPDLAYRCRYYRYDEQILFGAHYALRTAPAWTSARFDPGIQRCFMGYFGAETLQDLESFSMSYIAGKLPDRILANWFVPTLSDPTQAPDGQHTAFAWIDVPYELHREGGPEHWDQVKHSLQERVTECWERYAPGFAKSVRATFPYTPLDVFRRNPSAIQGNWIGGSVSPGQILLDRPFGGDVHAPRTPLGGLYLSNSIWPPGTTFLGAGYVAATVVAEDLEVRDQDWWCAEPLHWWQSFLAGRG